MQDCAGFPRKGADSDGTPYYVVAEQGLAQKMGSRATRCQDGQAIIDSALRAAASVFNVAGQHHRQRDIYRLNHNLAKRQSYPLHHIPGRGWHAGPLATMAEITWSISL